MISNLLALALVAGAGVYLWRHWRDLGPSPDDDHRTMREYRRARRALERVRR